MKKTLYINCCVRKNSRTKILADKVFERLGNSGTEIKLENIDLKPLDSTALEKRDKDIVTNNFDDKCYDYAKALASADEIIIAAPYWDLSFPASLKLFTEHCSVIGITFAYNENGERIGLCKAKRLIYVTTAGGVIGEYDLGYEYIKALFRELYGVKESIEIRAERLDIYGEDAESIITGKLAEIDSMEL